MSELYSFARSSCWLLGCGMLARGLVLVLNLPLVWALACGDLMTTVLLSMLGALTYRAEAGCALYSSTCQYNVYSALQTVLWLSGIAVSVRGRLATAVACAGRVASARYSVHAAGRRGDLPASPDAAARGRLGYDAMPLGCCPVPATSRDAASPEIPDASSEICRLTKKNRVHHQHYKCRSVNRRS